MTEDTNKSAEEIQDQDLEQAQGGVIINGDHHTIGRISANESSQTIGDEVSIIGDDPFNTADGRTTEDTLADTSGWTGAAPTPYP